MLFKHLLGSAELADSRRITDTMACHGELIAEMRIS